MTAAPVSAGAGLIAVAPSSLGSAAATGSAMAAQVAALALHPLPAGAITNAQCFQAFSSAGRLVGEALRASAESFEQIARSLQAAADAYALADRVAVAPETG